MVPLLIALLMFQEAVRQDTPQQIERLHQQFEELFQAGRYEEAASHQRRALRVWEQLAQTHPVDLAAPHFNLAATYVALRKFRAAEEEARRARQLVSSLTSPADRNRISVLVAQLLFDSGDYAAAEQELRPILADLQGTELGTALNDLAAIRAALGDLVEAQQLLERALKVKEDCGAAAGDLGRVVANLGLLRFRQRDINAAASLYARAIPMLEARPGVNEIELGMALAEYSQVLRQSGQRAEAGRMEKRAKEILGRSARNIFQTVDVRDLR